MRNKKLWMLNHKNITLEDSFWNKYVTLVSEVILPFMWQLINDNVPGAEKSYCIQNFRIAAGLEQGQHKGMVFQDTDVAKWLEAVGYALASKRDTQLEELADQAIDLIALAQCEDGYLNTYYTITGTPRWSNLFEGHELYTAGHMMEAAVAYFNATGKDKILQVVCRFADYLCTVFGPEEGKIHGYPGHPEVELALIKLYRVTQKKEYLELANFFVRERGKEPCYFKTEDCIKNKQYIFPEFKDFDMDYCQAHMPLLEQDTAEGHSVRAVYLYSAMADLAYELHDASLLKQCEQLWENIVEKRMYVTGSIGSASYGERFTTDYDLPNNTNYSETCASIGLAMFSNRMFQITKDSKYVDIVEKALYNTLLSGISVDGKHYFYVNPLEVVPEIAEKNPTMKHVKTERQAWFGVACCPPNIARTLASLSDYAYATEESTFYLNLFIGARIQTVLDHGNVHMEVKCDYPNSGRIRLLIEENEGKKTFTVAVRKPATSPNMIVKVNGHITEAIQEKGYYYITRCWREGDIVEVELDVSFRFVRCNPKVRDNIGKVCLMKGPLVYCLEEADNGGYLSSISIDTSAAVKEVIDEKLFGGTQCALLEGKQINYDEVGNSLYSMDQLTYRSGVYKAVPYCYWNNRGKGEMLVWMREC